MNAAVSSRALLSNATHAVLTVLRWAVNEGATLLILRDGTVAIAKPTRRKSKMEVPDGVRSYLRSHATQLTDALNNAFVVVSQALEREGLLAASTWQAAPLATAYACVTAERAAATDAANGGDAAALDWLERFDERAGILEYDGQVSRVLAELLAAESLRSARNFSSPAAPRTGSASCTRHGLATLGGDKPGDRLLIS